MAKRPCPSCESKAYLTEMDLTAESLMELAAAEPTTPDTCGDEQYKSRLAVCNSCPHLLGGITCDGCGCFVQLRARNKSGHCAFGKW